MRTLVTRSLAYYWRTGLMVAFGLLLATAVITGSLVIGDSVRGSLRDTALSRLGSINHALVSPARYFRAELATEIAKAQPKAVDAAVPLLSTSGALRNPTTDVVVPDVSVLGIDGDFWDFFEVSPPALEGRECALNQAVAEALDVSAGDAILLTAHRQSDINLSTLFAKRGTQESAPTLRLTVASVLQGRGAGDFRLDAQNKTPLNLFMSREWLAERLDRRGQANVIVAHTPAAQESTLSAGLKDTVTLSDVGIHLE
ncbi:MAG: ABC transporter permease, partial [Armatimonadota bacterium]